MFSIAASTQQHSRYDSLPSRYMLDYGICAPSSASKHSADDAKVHGARNATVNFVIQTI